MREDIVPVTDCLITRDTNQEYHSKEGYVGASDLIAMKRSPLHFQEAEFEETDALFEGRAYHTFILEPEQFRKEYHIFNPADRPDPQYSMNAKKNVAWFQELQVKFGQLISMTMYEKFLKMKKRLFDDFYIRHLLRDGDAETSYYCTYEGVGIRCRPDYLKNNAIIDLKTTRDASKDGFTRNSANFNYHIQAALYHDIIWYMTGVKRPFYFICQEKEPPFATNIFSASAQFLAVGQYEYEIIIQQYKKCIETGEYRGYSIFADNKFGVEEIEVPAYKIKELVFHDKK